MIAVHTLKCYPTSVYYVCAMTNSLIRFLQSDVELYCSSRVEIVWRQCDKAVTDPQRSAVWTRCRRKGEMGADKKYGVVRYGAVWRSQLAAYHRGGSAISERSCGVADIPHTQGRRPTRTTHCTSAGHTYHA